MWRKFRAAMGATSARADVPWAANTLQKPDAVKPVDATIAVRDGRIDFELKRYSLLRVRVPRG